MARACSSPSRRSWPRSRSTFGLHELAVEDAQNFHLRPKIEQYDDDGVQLRHPAHRALRRRARGGRVRRDQRLPRPDLRDHRAAGRGERAARRPAAARAAAGAARRGPGAVLWAILDQVVDDYAPVVAGLERDIDQIEATVFSGAAAPTERIYSLRREATDFYRAVHPLLAPWTRSSAAPTTDRRRAAPYLRDVHDHLLLVNEEVAAQRDLLGTCCRPTWR